jgi:hypothetical protein
LASGISLRIPLQRPSVVSNLKIASIARVPARVTMRGGVRSGSVPKPLGLARPACVELFDDGVEAADGPDVPGQGEHVAPMAVGMKQDPERGVARFPERPFELRQPAVCSRQEGVRFGRHSRTRAPLRSPHISSAR